MGWVSFRWGTRLLPCRTCGVVSATARVVAGELHAPSHGIRLVRRSTEFEARQYCRQQGQKEGEVRQGQQDDAQRAWPPPGGLRITHVCSMFCEGLCVRSWCGPSP